MSIVVLRRESRGAAGPTRSISASRARISNGFSSLGLGTESRNAVARAVTVPSEMTIIRAACAGSMLSISAC
jgi:hypothetical protein